MNRELYEIWSEGFVTSFEHGGATFHGTEFGVSFKDACQNLANKDPEFKRNFNSDRMTFWGCNLFDNESDARSYFG